MEFVQKNIEYKLAEGTADERAVPMAAKATLGGSWDATFGRLFQIHESLASPLGTPFSPEVVTLIRALWLTWCYAANDITNLRNELAQAGTAVEEMAKTQQQLAEQLAEMQGKLDALTDARTTVTDAAPGEHGG